MKKIIVSYNCMEHTITINNNKVSVFNNHFQEHVSPSRFDKYIVSRDFTGTVNSEEIFKAAARNRSVQSASLFIGNSMCWSQSAFELHGWK